MQPRHAAQICGTLSLFAALAAPPVLADTSPTFEITPFAGGRIGGGFDIEDETTGNERSVDLDGGASFGVDLALYAHEAGFYELLYSSQGTSLDVDEPTLEGVDIRVDYLHVGGTAFFPTDRFYVPYLSLTLGATFLEPSGGNYDAETKFSGSIGGGFRFPLNDSVAVVLGLRGYLTLIDSDTDLFCVSNAEQAGCLVKSSGSTFFQTEAQLGVSFAF